MSESPTTAEALRQRIQSRQALVGIIGLGYVGLPLALTFAEAGFPVLGFDLDPEKIAALERGESYIRHVSGERLQAATGFQATTDMDRLGEPDALLVCVPTPLTESKEPDLGYVESTTAEVARRLRPGQLVVLESTTYPGTTEEVLLPVLGADGLACGTDFFLAYSPEREDPGNPDFSTGTIPKVVGGLDETSGDLAEALYAAIVPQVVRVASAAIAEATKLTENIFRAVNIALVNELKMVYDKLGIDVWDVLDAAETKPFGFMRFDPGPGWGGHCIPIDPFYLSWLARREGIAPRFVELAGEVNVEMPDWVLAKLEAALNERGRDLTGAAVLLLGLAYKADVDDPRESPAFEILDRLLAAGAEVNYHDPHVPEAPRMRSWPDLPALRSEPLTPEALEAADAVVVVTSHRAIDWYLVRRHARLVIDTRGVYRDADPKIVRA